MEAGSFVYEDATALAAFLAPGNTDAGPLHGYLRHTLALPWTGLCTTFEDQLAFMDRLGPRTGKLTGTTYTDRLSSARWDIAWRIPQATQTTMLHVENLGRVLLHGIAHNGEHHPTALRLASLLASAGEALRFCADPGFVPASTLKATAGSWSPQPSTLTYRWHRNGVPLAGATKATYRFTSRDYGKVLSVKVTGKRTGYVSRTVSSTVR